MKFRDKGQEGKISNRRPNTYIVKQDYSLSIAPLTKIHFLIYLFYSFLNSFPVNCTKIDSKDDSMVCILTTYCPR